jgi:uncharacterized protein YecE (DUF72 family)
MAMIQRVLVGTSGWHYPHWKGPFYPAKITSDEMFAFYCRRFVTVEINNSFYRLPSGQTFRSWKRQAPSHFLFAVKASRYITHMKKLKDPEQSLAKFLSAATGLGSKLGPVLFQMPPFWSRDTVRLSGFLGALPDGLRCAFEFRHPSWFHREVYALLERHDAAFCAFDLAGEQSPRVLTGTFGYLRLHGPAEQKYSGRYSKPQLRQWLSCCERWIKEGAQQVFVYFDNDQAGYAAINAQELQEISGQGS